MTRIAIATLALLAIHAAEARAQMSMGSFKGYLTGHVGAISGGDLANERMTGGASVSVQEDAGWGAELDFGHTPDATAGRQVIDVTTYLVNAMWVKPGGTFRPFGAAGAGVMQVNGCDRCLRPSRTYDLGLSAGAGVFVVFNDWVGIRGDARYFYSGAEHRDLGRPNGLSFLRVSIGATFMWAILP